MKRRKKSYLIRVIIWEISELLLPLEFILNIRRGSF